MLILCSLFCITLISWVIHGKFQIVWAVQSLWRQGQVCGSSDVVGKNPNKTGNTIHKCSFTCWGLKLKWFSGITHKYSTGINLWICVNLSVKCKKKKKATINVAEARVISAIILMYGKNPSNPLSNSIASFHSTLAAWKMSAYYPNASRFVTKVSVERSPNWGAPMTLQGLFWACFSPEPEPTSFSIPIGCVLLPMTNKRILLCKIGKLPLWGKYSSESNC